MKATIKIACRKYTGERLELEALGELIGPFVIHRMAGTGAHLESHSKWGVTHASTGFNAAHGPTKKCCIHAARRLRDVGADWSFTEPEETKSFSQEHLDAIRVIRVACAMGGEA